MTRNEQRMRYIVFFICKSNKYFANEVWAIAFDNELIRKNLYTEDYDYESHLQRKLNHSNNVAVQILAELLQGGNSGLEVINVRLEF